MQVVSASGLEKWNALSDVELVAHVVNGRTAPFEVLMRRHGERAYRTIRAVVTDDARAEELLEQVFVDAYADLRQFDPAQTFAIWLTQIAVRAAGSRPRDAVAGPKRP